MEKSDIPPVGKGYRPDMQRIVDSYSSHRNVEEYRRILGFDSKDEFLAKIPRGAKLLDIGSGGNAFSEDMKTLRPDVKVFNLNPGLADRLNRSLARQNMRTSNDVSGISPGLPYKDESFDIVLDCMASIYRADKLFKMSREDANKQKLQEVIRVLKPGGFAAVGPLIRTDERSEFMANAKAIKGILATRAKIVELSFQSFHVQKLPL